jgi:hypothetical protein
MARIDEDRIHNCIHEAAHYVAFTLAGPRIPQVLEIWIGDRDSRPHVRLQHLHALDWADLVKRYDTAMDFAVALLAGPAASMTLLGYDCDDFGYSDDSDQLKAIRILDDLAWNTDEDIEAQFYGKVFEPLVDRAALITRAFIEDYQQRILYVARQLYHGGSLDGEGFRAATRSDPVFGLTDLVQANRNRSGDYF